ncbi:MAG: hypothetical protein JO224_13035 [Pelomonas sp.]|nr:hypothetical protein [Roseateles sp.]
MRLSPEARQRLLGTAVFNSKGELASYYLGDIRKELSPTDAYRVLALFGGQEFASTYNNGIVGSATDAQVKSLAFPPSGAHPLTAGYYCNGGYCTSHRDFTCDEGKCTPPL